MLILYSNSYIPGRNPLTVVLLLAGVTIVVVAGPVIWLQVPVVPAGAAVAVNVVDAGIVGAHTSWSAPALAVIV